MEINKWEIFENKCRGCHNCPLAATRTNVVIGRGNKNGDILFVGEGPGRSEDEQGVPFVGQAGQLLDQALASCKLPPESYYIANVVKCRPPENRTPYKEECQACLPLLREQYLLIRPKIIVCLGACALNAMIDPNARISAVRGQWIERKGTLFLPTYHPAALLRNENLKIDMWRDIKKVYLKWAEIKTKEGGKNYV